MIILVLRPFDIDWLFAEFLGHQLAHMRHLAILKHLLTVSFLFGGEEGLVVARAHLPLLLPGRVLLFCFDFVLLVNVYSPFLLGNGLFASSLFRSGCRRLLSFRMLPGLGIEL